MQEYAVKHIAIIPDGNRRWARARGKPGWFGHKVGAKTFEDILKKALELNVYCVSFWGMSTDNFSKREAHEVKYLLSIFKGAIQKAIVNKELIKNDVRISILGEWRELFPKKIVTLFEKTILETKNRKRHILNLLLAYDGKSEMARALKNACLAKKEVSSPKEFLFTRELPPVDLVIRTGGEPHLSAGFMMWDISDAHLYFSDKLWPDFTATDFELAVAEFKKRERRFGR